MYENMFKKYSRSKMKNYLFTSHGRFFTLSISGIIKLQGKSTNDRIKNYLLFLKLHLNFQAKKLLSHFLGLALDVVMKSTSFATVL